MDEALVNFKLLKDKDTAVIRLLHSSTDTIEKVSTHWIDVGGKKSCFKCNGDGCPLCARNVSKNDNIYIRLIDYTDNTVKVWNRTDKIISRLKDIEAAFGKLSNVVLKITRDGDQFPTYTIIPVNASQYPAPDPNSIDVKISYRFFRSRSNEDINTFLTTGVLPEKPKSTFIPKEEYIKMKNQQNTAQPIQPQVQNVYPQINNAQTSGTSYNIPPSSATNDPFMSSPFAQTAVNTQTMNSQSQYSDPFLNIKRV